MNRFSPLLRDINERLDLPQPGKSQILIEIAADMEDYYLALREKDVSEDEAANLVNEKFDFTKEALDELVTVHQTMFRRLFLGLSSTAQTRFEQIVLLLTILFVAGLSGRIAFSSEFILSSSAYIWPVLGVTAVAGVFALYKSYMLYVKKDHNLNSAKKGLNTLLIMSGVSLVFSQIGYFLELFNSGPYGLYFSSKMLVVTQLAEDMPPLEGMLNWFMMSASFILASLLSAMVIGLAWYLLTGKVAKIEEAEAAFLIEM